jgi:hypothetical protein
MQQKEKLDFIQVAYLLLLTHETSVSMTIGIVVGKCISYSIEVL